MRFEFTADEHVKVKTFLKKHEISKSLLAKIKFSGGDIHVNGKKQNAIYLLDIGDKVAIDIPAEESFSSLRAVERELEIVYEDEHFLILNKPSGIASIPSVNHSNTMANFVKAYYISNHYENQQIHIVTRLDKDTSGLMLFAKHGYAHARLDKQLQKKIIEKHYYALVRWATPVLSSGRRIRRGSRSSTRSRRITCRCSSWISCLLLPTLLSNTANILTIKFSLLRLFSILCWSNS